MNVESEIHQVVTAARAASYVLTAKSAEERCALLLEVAARLEAGIPGVLSANRLDLRRGAAAKLSDAFLERLMLDDGRVRSIASSVREVAELADPIGVVLEESVRPNGLRITKKRVPIGVVAIIYESRPNVTIDSAALCLKAGNAVILRGGSDAQATNEALADIVNDALQASAFPTSSVQLIRTPDREAVKYLVRADGYVDVAIPRGGEGLIRTVTELARVPVIKHYKGVCHVYVDADADLESALRIVENAKCQRPAVCNAAETLLVHAAVAERFIPKTAALLRSRGVELRGDEASREFVPDMLPATEEDWFEEYLSLVLSVRVVSNAKAAIEHINHYGSHHSDAIVTESRESAEEFLQGVDSAVVYVNASTRFTDGGEFGKGAEIGISTDKLHARGPMGLEELTTYKYLVRGSGQIR